MVYFLFPQVCDMQLPFSKRPLKAGSLLSSVEKKWTISVDSDHTVGTVETSAVITSWLEPNLLECLGSVSCVVLFTLCGEEACLVFTPCLRGGPQRMFIERVNE
jgi:hypothetical protein